MIVFDSAPADRRFLAGVLLFCAFASLVSSVWCVYIDDVVNNDAVEYIRAAELFAARNWSGAFNVHQWPFFSALMWITSAALDVDYEVAGYVLNTVFFTLATIFFVLTVHAFGGTSRRILTIAALVAVLHPSFNEYRAYIMRDAGYLAFYLFALFCLARHSTMPSRATVFGTIVALMLASLFRIEGVVFLLATPLLFVVTRRNTDGHLWKRLSILLASTVLLAIILGWWLIAPATQSGSESLPSSPLHVVMSAWAHISDMVAQKMTVLRSEFLSPYSAEYAWVLFVFAVGMLLLSATFTQLTIPWALFIIGGLWAGLRFEHKSQNRLWLSLVSMHLLILLVFTVIKLFLVARYPLALTITVLTLAPFAVDRMFSVLAWRPLSGLRRALIALLIVWGIGESVSGLDNVTRAGAIKEAGRWLAAQNHAPDLVVTNDRRLAYYAGVHQDLEYIEPSVPKILHGLRGGLWPDAAYVALRIRRSDSSSETWILEALGGAPLRIVDSGIGDRVMIYYRP